MAALGGARRQRRADGEARARGGRGGGGGGGDGGGTGGTGGGSGFGGCGGGNGGAWHSPHVIGHISRMCASPSPCVSPSNQLWRQCSLRLLHTWRSHRLWHGGGGSAGGGDGGASGGGGGDGGECGGDTGAGGGGGSGSAGGGGSGSVHSRHDLRQLVETSRSSQYCTRCSQMWPPYWSVQVAVARGAIVARTTAPRSLAGATKEFIDRQSVALLPGRPERRDLGVRELERPSTERLLTGVPAALAAQFAERP